MKRLSLSVMVTILSVIPITFFFLPGAWGIDKLKFATAIKVAPHYYLPILAAQEKGFWKERGLDVEWVPFKGGPDMRSAIVGGHVTIGMDTAVTLIPAASAGVPAIIISDIQNTEALGLYVLPGSPIKEPKLFKGKIGVTMLGALDHASTRLVARVLGIEKDIRYVGTGGMAEKIAALKAGAVDAITIVSLNMMELIVKGEVRELLNTDEYRPKEWMHVIGFGHREFIKKEPDKTRRVVAGVLAGVRFLQDNPGFAAEKMKEFQGYSAEASKRVTALFRFTTDGKINRKALENVRNFVIDYGLVAKEKVPPLDELYSREITG